MLFEEGIKPYKQMLSALGGKGWEIESQDEDRLVQRMKRTFGGAISDTSQEPANLLQQLACLHDAGILTDEEFETKKAEILKRI